MSGIYGILRARLLRGFSPRYIGPNEARILFDGSVPFAAAVLGVLFIAFFYPAAEITALRSAACIVAAPTAVVGASILLGVYSRLRGARSRTKATALAVAAFTGAVVVWLSSGSLALAAFWLCVAGPPIVLARVLIGIAQGNRATPFRAVVTDRGPVLVIGGAGYIGSHTVAQLLERGRAVRVLDRLMYGRDSLSEFAGNPRFEFFEGDAADIGKLTEAMRGSSAVVHLAGLVGDPACAVDPAFTRQTNIVTTRMVRLVAQSMGVRRFVFASSCSVYGVSDEPIDETGSLNPISLYAETKIDSERELLQNVPDDFFITVLRFATVFGHSRRPRFDLVANLFAAQAVHDGVITVFGPEQWRPFIHVRDLGRAITMVVDADPRLVQSQIFNVGDDDLNRTILDLAHAVRDQSTHVRPVEVTVTETPEDLRNYAVSFRKIREALGFRAETSIEAGVREMIDLHVQGVYQNYRGDVYSNVAMTRRAVDRFNDPDELTRIYAPLSR